MRTRRPGAGSSREPTAPTAGTARETAEDSARTRHARALAAQRLAIATQRVHDAETSGDAKARKLAAKQLQRAARALAGPEGDVRSVRRGAELLDVERAVLGKLSTEGRAYAQSTAATAVAIIAEEGITGTLDLLLVAVGSRVLAHGLALLDERGAGDRSAVYALDRGVALVERGVTHARAARENDPRPLTQHVLSAPRLVAAEHDDEGDEDHDEPEDVPEPPKAPEPHPVPESPAAPNVVAARPRPVAHVDRTTGTVTGTTWRDRVAADQRASADARKPRPMVWDPKAGGWRPTDAPPRAPGPTVHALREMVRRGVPLSPEDEARLRAADEEERQR